MKTLPLTQGKETIVDDDDYEVLRHFTWCCSQGRATRRQKNFGIIKRNVFTLMHRVILGVCGNPDVQVDHINGNMLDNRRSNLRVCTQQQNLLNKRKRGDGKHSVFKGTFRTKNTWWARIEHTYLGSFPSEIEAAKSYDRAAEKLHGEFAATNKSLGLLND